MVAALNVKAVRERVGHHGRDRLFQGAGQGCRTPDAAALLDRLTANKHAAGRSAAITLTHMLNRRGRIELETTIVKLNDDSYYLVCAAFFENACLDHLNQNLAGEDVQVILRSNDWAALALNGPKSREVLAQCTDADVCRMPGSAG